MAEVFMEFGTNDPETVKLWSEKVIRNAEKFCFFTPMMYSLDDPKALRSPDAGKGQGIIQVHTDFEGKAADTVTFTRVGDLTDRGTHGDALAKNAAEPMDADTMSMTFDYVVHSTRTNGPMQERRAVTKFREVSMPALARWARNKVEGAIVLALWGLTSWNNSGKLKCWNATAEASVFGNAITAYDSNHLLYAGDASSDATIDSSDVLTAQLLDKALTLAYEDNDIPVEPLTIDGEDCMILLTSGRGIEQLSYDDDFRDAQRNWTKPQNPMLKRAIGKYKGIYVIEYPRCLNPAANVGRSILVGKDALHFAKVEDWNVFEQYDDIHKRRKLISMQAAMGVKADVFSSTYRNSIAIDHYVRT